MKVRWKLKRSQVKPCHHPLPHKCPWLTKDLDKDQIIFKKLEGVWERLSSAKHAWVVPVLFQGVEEAGVANRLNFNKSGMVRWFFDRGFN